jgi:putative DNA-invertase from lambdoid prophage Rac
VFAYCRVSEKELTTANQVQQIASAGFSIDPKRIVEEMTSGASASAQRPQFQKLLDRLEATRRLDRDQYRQARPRSDRRRLDDQQAGGTRHSRSMPAAGGADLTSAAGKMTMGLMATFAQFERDLLIERTNARPERARAECKRLGRKTLLTEAGRIEVRAAAASGTTIAQIAREYDTSRQTIMQAVAAA